MCVINGESGDKNGEKLISKLFFTIIDETIKCKFTWTGKAAVGKTKIALRDYKEIINLMYAVIRRADETYTMTKCEKNLTYKVLKPTAKK